MPGKPKIKIRELKPRIKIISEGKKEQSEVEEKQEESLEDITAGAPSARELAPLGAGASRASQDIPQAPVTAEMQRDDSAETASSPRYAVQQNVTEKEIRKNYETREASFTKAEKTLRNPMILSEREKMDDAFRNREIASLKSQEEGEESKYDVSPSTLHSETRRRYPWEA